MRHGVYFGGESGGGVSFSHQRARVKAGWHPVALLKDRCGDEFLTHCWHAQNCPSNQGLTAFIFPVRVRPDRLPEMQMIISCSVFHENQRLLGESYLSIQVCTIGCRAHLWAGWWTCDWQIFTTQLAGYMQTNRRAKSTVLKCWSGENLNPVVFIGVLTSSANVGQHSLLTLVLMSNGTETVV